MLTVFSPHIVRSGKGLRVTGDVLHNETGSVQRGGKVTGIVHVSIADDLRLYAYNDRGTKVAEIKLARLMK